MTAGNGLPPLPKPPSPFVDETVEIRMPGDLRDDLMKAAKEQLGINDLGTALVMTATLWRYPPESTVAAAPRQRKPRSK